MVSYYVIMKSNVLHPRSDSRNWPRSSECVTLCVDVHKKRWRNRDVLMQNLLMKCDFSVMWLIESCIRAPVLLNVLNSLGKSLRCSAKPRILFSPTRLINSIIHEHSCKILYVKFFFSFKVAFLFVLLIQNKVSFLKESLAKLSVLRSSWSNFI